MAETTAGVSDPGEPVPNAAPRRRPKRAEASGRGLLLEAARIEFAAKGLEGARVDEIARRAGVNKQLVYHHFNNKDDLYKAVLDAAYAKIRAEEAKLDLGKRDPQTAMRRLVTFSFDYLAGNRDFVTLLTDENLHRARHLKKSSDLPGLHSQLVAMIAGTLDRGAAEGIFRRDVDPVQLYISIAGLGFFYFNNIHTLSSIFSRNFDSRNQIAQRREHVADLILSALRPD